MYIKRSDLFALKESVEYKRINESFKKHKFEKLTKYDIFLSHATDDKEIMQLSKTHFEKLGKTVYVAELDDPIDNNADATITKEFVKTLQNAMAISDSFCYVLSAGERKSTWMPWELGYFDGKYGSKKSIQVLSIINTSQNEENKYFGHEYLKLYPHKLIDNLKALIQLND